MDADSWSARLSSLSRRYQSALQSRSDLFLGFEEVDGDDDMREEFPCPFCSEFFDIVGLCCHIDDEHPVEAKNGVCPVCAMRVGVDMVAHITLQHGSVFKMQQRKRRSSKGGSHSTLQLLRKELREGNLQSLFGSSYMPSSNNAAPDPLLSSFILPMSDELLNLQLNSSADKKGKDDSTIKRYVCLLLADGLHFFGVDAYENTPRSILIGKSRILLGLLNCEYQSNG